MTDEAKSPTLSVKRCEPVQNPAECRWIADAFLKEGFELTLHQVQALIFEWKREYYNAAFQYWSPRSIVDELLPFLEIA